MMTCSALERIAEGRKENVGEGTTRLHRVHIQNSIAFVVKEALLTSKAIHRQEMEAGQKPRMSSNYVKHKNPQNPISSDLNLLQELLPQKDGTQESVLCIYTLSLSFPTITTGKYFLTSQFPWLSHLQSFLFSLAIHTTEKYWQKEACSFFV